VAFWVKDLDKYLLQINDNNSTLTHYVGLKWYHDDLDKTFYSLIIQSPHSQRVFEFISFNKPNLSNYPNLRKSFKFSLTSIQRASFKQYPEGEYPWTGYLGTIYKLGLPVLPDIVPIKISFATSNIQQSIKFYTNIMEGKLLDLKKNVMDTLDSVPVSYAFLQPLSSFIEIQYVQRPLNYTYGTFTTETYKNLLVDTHNDRISGVYCGLDRWFDNHYGYDSTIFVEDDPGFMDRVFFNVYMKGLKHRIYYIDHQRDDGPGFDSDSFDIDEVNLYDVEYKLYVFDANGQTIQMIGYFVDTFIEQHPPIYMKQWCATPCPGNQEMGIFDLKNKKYIEDEQDIVYQILYGNISEYDMMEKEEFDGISYADHTILILGICVAVILLSLIIYCFYIFYKENKDDSYGQETQSLLQK